MNVALGTMPAEPDQQNEDFAAATPGAAVLLDGAGVAGAETGCVHGIAWFSSTLGGLLLGNIAGDPARPLADCLAGAIRGVRSLHEDTCDLAYRASPTSTVVAVRVGGGALEYLVLGDSTLLLAGQDGKTTAVTDDRLDQVGRQLRASVDRLPTGTPEHAAALAQYRDDLTGLRNRPGGFWIAGPEPRAAEHALTGTVPLESLASVTLLSDGATRPSTGSASPTGRTCWTCSRPPARTNSSAVYGKRRTAIPTGSDGLAERRGTTRRYSTGVL